MDTTVVSLVITVVALSSLAPLTWACSCMRAHPQTHYCKSDYVIQAVIGGYTEVPEATLGYYNVTIVNALKGLENSSLMEENEDGTRHSVVWTSMFDSMCGVHLQTGMEYIIGGYLKESGMQVGLCGLVVPYNSLTRRQKNGFKHKFKLNCDCQVKYCGLPGVPCMPPPPPPPPPCMEPDPANCPPPQGPPPSDQCMMHFQSDILGCQERHTLCRHHHGNCQWTDNNFNQACQIHTRRRRLRRH